MTRCQVKLLPGEAALSSRLVAAFQAGLDVLFAETCVPSLPESLLVGPTASRSPEPSQAVPPVAGALRNAQQGVLSPEGQGQSGWACSCVPWWDGRDIARGLRQGHGHRQVRLTATPVAVHTDPGLTGRATFSE